MESRSAQDTLLARAAVASHDGVELSIIIPTFNEAGNISELLRRIAVCLVDFRWEAIVVDDNSPDGTAEAVRGLACTDPRLKCLQRIGRRGLASACIEGMGIASGDFFAVIDADLQHDEQLLPSMLLRIRDTSLDLVVGSRYMTGGGVESWSPTRHLLSRIATTLTRCILNVGLTDPMSGFFMIRAQAVRSCSNRLSGTGFKLLLDLVASSTVPLKFVELPYRFSSRQSGISKLDERVAWAFFVLLLHKAVARIRRRFGLFCLVGSSGVVLQLSLLWAVQALLGTSFAVAQTIAVIASMISNFTLNNRLTYRDARLRGNSFMVGLSRFAVLCSGGAVVNVVVATALHHVPGIRLASVAAGILVGAICNFATTSILVWRKSSGEVA